MQTESSPSSLQVGSTLAHFQLLEVLGEGGMGVVYRAQDLIIQRQVALKVMQDHLARQGKSKDRFLREARTAAILEHDHIVRIYEVNEDSGIPFIAMELLKGKSLDKYLAIEGTIPLAIVIRIIRQIAFGLLAAHEKGLVHRDIKPSNVWLESLGDAFRCKLLDFGLARAEDGDSISTKSGQMIGTPNYMSPEQWKGRDVDHRSDLYSIGVMLYQMTTGKYPFEADSHANLMYHVLMEEPKEIQEINPRLPNELCQLTMRLIAKEKEKRPRDLREVIASLDQISKQLARSLPSTELAYEDSSIRILSIVEADTFPGNGEPQTLPIPEKSVQKPGTGFRWIHWLLMLGCLLVGIVATILLIANKPIANPTTEMVQLRDAKDQLENRLQNLESKLRETQEKLRTERDSEQKRQGEFVLLEKEKTRLTKELELLQKKEKEQQAKVVELEKSESNQKAQLEAQSKSLADLKNQKSTIEQKLLQADTKLREKESATQKSQLKEKEYLDAMNKWNEEKAKLNQELDVLGQDYAKLTKELTLAKKMAPSRPLLLDSTGEKSIDPQTVRNAQKAWADYLGVPAEFALDMGEGVKMEFILIPPGKYLMGSRKGDVALLMKTFGMDDEKEFAQEQPSHEVTISNAFYLGKTEITRGQFSRFVILEGYITQSQKDEGGMGWDQETNTFAKAKKYSWKETGWEATDQHPVVNVSWYDAKEMAKWMTVNQIQFPEGFHTVRLPREEEWEYACRSGTVTWYPNNQDDIETIAKIANIADKSAMNQFSKWSTIKANDGFVFTAPVKHYQPNAFGLYDMIGNVREWCEDIYDPEAYQKINAKGPLIISQEKRRILRGGAWDTVAKECRSPFRDKGSPNACLSNLGFRLAISYTPR